MPTKAYVLPGRRGLVYYPPPPKVVPVGYVGYRGLRGGSSIFAAGAAARGEMLDYGSDWNDDLAPTSVGYNNTNAPGNFSGFSGLGGFAGVSSDASGAPCGCGVQSELQSTMQAHPFLTLAGAFLLGYLVRGVKK